ncbi:MAG: N-acetylmuramoyl-L-alanine amidase [Ginsengibacter sp.]
MLTIAWYLLKVVICSGILYVYYFAALRNRVFHQWNRFYLLTSIALSMLAPLVKINIRNAVAEKGTVIQMLQTITASDEAAIKYTKSYGLHVNFVTLINTSYLLITLLLLSIFFISLFKIKRLKKRYPETKVQDISFIATDAKGTPFSFLNSIFWNNAIDLNSKPGQQIFNHEIAHIKEKHSYDKIFMSLLLTVTWINPFFWLMRKELNMIHEFIADKRAVEDNDTNAFAEMVLQTVYPGQKFTITNNFFYSPLKRRIIMLTKNRNTKVSYLSRLLVLPVAAIVFFAFTLKIKSAVGVALYNGETITVVIDAGHGGNDNGAVSIKGLTEKDINLSIAKKIFAVNSNSHIKILLTRDNDKPISVQDRVRFSKANNADIFISIHVNLEENNSAKNGFSVIIDKTNNAKTQLLASSIIHEIKNTYTIADEIGTSQNNVWVLANNSCPAALIECGYISNSTDEAFITNSANQEKIARNILNAVEKFAMNLENAGSENILKVSDNDTVRNMYYKNKMVTRLESNNKKIKVTYQDGTKETITQQEADKRGFIFPPPPPPPPESPPAPPVYPVAPPPPPIPPVPPVSDLKANASFTIDGKISSTEKAKDIDARRIKSVNVIKGGNALAKK